jgi:hypothetical protein
MNKILLLIIILSLIARIYLLNTVSWTILGADVGRMATISHALFLKKEITSNLQPYDMATGFFYFPLTYLLPLFFEFFGIDSITTITNFTLIFSILSILIIYKIMRIFLNEKQSLIAATFYSFALDFVILFSFFGMFSYGFASFFFLIVLWQILELFFNKKNNFILLLIGIIGIVGFHWYMFLNIILTLFCFLTYEYAKNKTFTQNKKIIKQLVITTFIGLLLFSPILVNILKYFNLSFHPENIIDIFMFTALRDKFSIIEKIETIFMLSYVGSIPSGILIGCLLLLIIQLKQLIKGKSFFWILFFSYFAIHSFTIFNELNLLRITTFLWLPYIFIFGYTFKKFKYLSFLIILFFITSPSIFYLTYSLNYNSDLFVPLVDFNKFNNAMDFIKNNIPENVTIIGDGGGSGCQGASAAYSERIFPLTSRKTFYFTDYCWAEYNRSEFVKRVDIYRRFSINPNDKDVLNELKEYNVGYVFIGKKRVGFDPKYFYNSTNFKVVYDDEEDFKIFEIK